MKRIALFLDGTWQSKSQNSNVYKMYKLCTDDSIIKYYDGGVGSTKSLWDKFSGGVFGSGVQTNIIEAYDFLKQHHEEGDEIFVYGFSRGAFTARSLVGFLDLVGLSGKHSKLSTKKLFNLYKERNYDVISNLIVWEMTEHVKVQMIGAFDTVKSIGSPLNIGGINKKWKFHNSSLCENTKNAFHAIAINERRDNFKPVLWTEKNDVQVVAQRYFAGDHCDIGGGHEGDDMASLASLNWMIKKSIECGLTINKSEEIQHVLLPEIHDSYDDMFFGLYSKLSKPYTRKIESSTLGVEIDYSVTHRLKHDPKYKPVNLLTYLNHFS